MLKAKKSPVFEVFFALYNKNLLRRKFHSLNVSGLDNLERSKMPFLIYANHSSWWDGLVAFQISRYLRLDSFIMMEEKQLKNLQFFRRLGAFSVVRENRRKALESINYAIEILKVNSQTSLWIFPQGEILPNDLRPLKFYNGLAHLVKKVGNCNVVPVAIKFEFLGKFKPEIFVKIGKPENYSSMENLEKKLLTENFTENLTELLNELKNDVVGCDFADYRNILL